MRRAAGAAARGAAVDHAALEWRLPASPTREKERHADNAKRSELREARGRRSAEWFDRRDLDGFLHRSWLKSTGVTDEAFRGRPVIGICNSWSELVNCNVHLRGLAEAVKRGVLQAGGFPLEFPVMSLGESLMKPTTMLYRNLMAMDVEESIRAYPLDGVVLLTGCDKTNPAQHPRRGERRHPVDRRHRRADAERPLARPRARLVHATAGTTTRSSAPAGSPRTSSPRSRTRCRARTATA